MNILNIPRSQVIQRLKKSEELRFNFRRSPERIYTYFTKPCHAVPYVKSASPNPVVLTLT
jgi:hypothetical protein